MSDEDLLGYAFDHTQSGVALVRGDGTIVRVNQAGAAMMGWQPEDITGDPFLHIVHPDDVELAVTELATSLETGHGGPIELRARRPDDSWIWLRARATRLPSAEPTTYVVFEDVTAEREVAQRLERSTRQQAAVASLGKEALAGAKVQDLVERAAKLVVAILEVDYSSVFIDDGHPDGLLLVAACGRFEEAAGHYREPRTPLITSLPEPVTSNDLRTAELWHRQQDMLDAGIVSLAGCQIVPRSRPPGLLVAGDEAPERFDAEHLSFLEAIGNVLASAIDATDAVEHLRHNALHDALTGLPNRTLLLDRLEVALEEAGGKGTRVAVLVCDLDRFKVVNDGLGHAAGDAVLRAVAERLRGEVRPGDTVGRFGGDEFVIVCPDVADLDTVIAIADRLALAAREPTVVLGTELVVSVSIGIAVGTGDGAGAADQLLRDADAAMYRAKEGGRARYELFDDDMRTRATARFQLEAELRRAIDRHELVLHYQPILDVASEELQGVEALIRWRHPERGLVPPDDFLGVAGDSGLVPEIGTWVFQEAARQAAAWVAEGWWGRRWMAVNLAPRQLSDRQLLDRMDDALAQSGLDPALLRVELTEEALVDDSAQTIAFLDGIRQRGVGISVDDFGTGYSSLTYLKRLPIDALKLDRAFVAELDTGGDDLVISAAVIVMAQALGLRVVAEGVETQAQLDVLRAMGCDLVQGFLFTPALPAEELRGWVAERGGACQPGDS